MASMSLGIPIQNVRNGSAARKWVVAQSYDVELAAKDALTSEKIMLEIATHATSRLISQLCSNKGITNKVIDAIWKNNPNEDMARRLAHNPRTSPIMLKTIGLFSERVGNLTIKGVIMRNQNTPPDYLTSALFTETDWNLHYRDHKFYAHCNPSTPIVDVIKSLTWVRVETPGHIKYILDKRKKDIQPLIDPWMAVGFSSRQSLVLAACEIPTEEIAQVKDLPFAWIVNLYSADFTWRLENLLF